MKEPSQTRGEKIVISVNRTTPLFVAKDTLFKFERDKKSAAGDENAQL